MRVHGRSVLTQKIVFFSFQSHRDVVSRWAVSVRIAIPFTAILALNYDQNAVRENTIGQSKVYQSDVIIFGIVLNRMRTIYAYNIDCFIFTYDRSFAIFIFIYDRGLVFGYRWVFLIFNTLLEQ